MSTTDITYKFGMADSTFELNKHFTGVLDSGVYFGFIPTVQGMSLQLTPGLFLDPYGRRINFANTETVDFQESSLSFDRIDVVCIRATYSNSTADQEARIIVVKGMESKYPVAPSNLGYFTYPIATVKIRKLSSVIIPNDIIISERAHTPNGILENVTSPLIRRLYGNIKLAGLGVSWNAVDNKLEIGSGEALIDGKYFSNTGTTSLAIAAMPKILSSKTGTNLSNIDITNQPSTPIKVQVRVTISAPSVGAAARISGLDQNGIPQSQLISVRDGSSTSTSLVFLSTLFFVQIDSVSLLNFDTGINKTACEVSAINKLFIYGTKNGSEAGMPIDLSSVERTGNTFIYLGQIDVDDSRTPRVLIAEEPVQIIKAMAGVVITQTYTIVSGNRVYSDLVFNGSTGVEINHMLGTTSYFVQVTPYPSDMDDAISVGSVLLDRQANKLIIKNSGSSRCKFEVLLVMGAIS